MKQNEEFLNGLKDINDLLSFIKYFFNFIMKNLKDKDVNLSITIKHKNKLFFHFYSLYKYSEESIPKILNFKNYTYIHFYKKVKDYTYKLYSCKSFFNSFNVNFSIFSFKKISLNMSFFERIKEFCFNKLKLFLIIENLKFNLKLREKSIIAINEFADLLGYLDLSNRNVFQSMFIGFTAESVGASRVVFYIYQKEEKMIYPNFIMVYKNKKLIPFDYYSMLKDVEIKIGEDVCGEVVRTKASVHLKNVKRKTIYKGIVDKRIGLKINSIVSIPLILNDEIIGIIEVANKEDERILDEYDFYVITIMTKLVISKMEQGQLLEWSITDNLTGLYNFHYFQMIFAKEIKRIIRYQRTLSIIMMDLDNFKSINDTYGHIAGNIVLKKIAEIIKNNIRKDVDIPIRYGGDEFLILCPEIDEQGATKLSERILNKIREEKIEIGNNYYLSTTISIGIGCFTPEMKDEEITKLVEIADKALYKAKGMGKNRIVVSKEFL